VVSEESAFVLLRILQRNLETEHKGATEQVEVLKGHGFSRAANRTK
jgi:hypothetical protein